MEVYFRDTHSGTPCILIFSMTFSFRLMFGVYENFSALIIIRMRRKIFVFLIFVNSVKRIFNNGDTESSITLHC